MRPVLLIPALLAPALVTATAPAADRLPPVATPSGKPVGCIATAQVRDTIVRDDRTVDFVMRGGSPVYRNTLPQSCPDLATEGRFSYATRSPQLCAIDQIRVIYYSAIQRGGACALGQFQPVRLAR